MTEQIIIDLSSNTMELYGNIYKIEAISEIANELGKLNLSSQTYHITYKPKSDKSSPIAAFFPLDINQDWFKKGRLETQKHKLGLLLSSIPMFDFCYEGNKTDPRIETSLDDRCANISGNCFSGEAKDLISPLVSWIAKRRYTFTAINIAFDYLNKHGLIALLEFFKYLYDFPSGNVEVNIYYKDADDKEGWEEYIDTASSFDGIDDFINMYSRNEALGLKRRSYE